MSTYVYRSRNVSIVAHIYESRLEEMGADWVRKKAREVAGLSKAKAPMRTGRLKASIRVDRRMKAGALTSIIVRAGAGYAAYVHEGTLGPIHSTSAAFGGRMRVPIHEGSPWKVWMYEVDGQRSQPFLASSMHEVLAGTIPRSASEPSDWDSPDRLP